MTPEPPAAPVPSPEAATGPPPMAEAAVVMGLIGEPMRWKALRALWDGSHPTVQDLARRLKCHPDLMSRHLVRMRKAGLVRRVRPQGSNGRYHHYEVPGRYLRALPDGRREIDYGVVALRF